MNPYQAYQEHQHAGQSRIDLLLALYDGAIERLERAAAALHAGDSATATPLLARVRLIVGGMAATVDLRHGELPQQFLRLYEFVLHQLEQGSSQAVADALGVLRTLREGLEAIRPEALRLERCGAIPSLDTAPVVRATA